MNEFEIKDYLQRLGCRKIRSTRNQVNATCPFESSHSKGRDDRPGFTVKVNAGGKSPYYCPSCKESDSMEWLVYERFGVSDWMGKDGYRPDDGLNARIWGKPIVESKKHPSEWPESLWTPFAGGVPRYALDRGLTIETCKAWRLGHDKARKRLMFSVRDRDGKFVGANGRTTVDSDLKYANYSWDSKNDVLSIKIDDDRDDDFVRFQRSFYVYGEHMLSHGTDIVLVEGQIDAINVWQAGFNAVAVMGSALAEKQSMRLLGMVPDGKGIVLMLDGDKAGQEATTEIRTKLLGKATLKIATCPEDSDPGDLTARELVDVISSAASVLG